MAAPRSTPSKPYLPGPSLAGMNGVQLLVSTYFQPAMITRMIRPVFSTTMAMFIAEDLLMPT